MSGPAGELPGSPERETQETPPTPPAAELAAARAAAVRPRGAPLIDAEALARADLAELGVAPASASHVAPWETPAEGPAPCVCQPCVDRRRRKARRSPPENGDYAAALTRQIAAYGRRVGDGDPEDLTTALGVLEALEEAIADAVLALNRQGWSWAAIGRCAIDADNPAGVTRQAAEQRWNR